MAGPEPTKPFWQQSLSTLNREQWEALCDGCALCCLHKLEDEDDGTLYYTRVCCQYLDFGQCACTVYAERTRLVPDCLRLSPETLDQVYFMPPSCAYRQLAEGSELPIWHPLLSGRRESVREAGMSACDFAISETVLDPEDALEYHIIDLD